MDSTPTLLHRHRSGWSCNTPVAIILTLLAILSPLYIDSLNEPDPDDESLILPFLLPILLLFLMIVAVLVSCYLDQSLTKFDPHWIHRVGGSSGGIVVVLAVLALVLRCKGFSETESLS